MLSMLAEYLVDSIDDLTMLQINTDGLTVKIKKEDLPKYYEICKKWEELSLLTLEYVEYSKMVIRDVNNYLAVSTKGKVKYKGAFEIDKELHKDNSFRVITIALSDYFIKGIPVEETIKNHTNIYDFCGRQKFKLDSYGETHSIKKVNGSFITNIQKQQKNVRYYVSNGGETFIKRYNKGTSELIHVGYTVNIFNNYVEKEFKDYNINYSFYIKECYKIIDEIDSKQLSLF